MLVEMLDGRKEGRLFDVGIDRIQLTYEKLGITSHQVRYFRHSHLKTLKVQPAISDYWTKDSRIESLGNVLRGKSDSAFRPSSENANSFAFVANLFWRRGVQSRKPESPGRNGTGRLA